MRYLGGGLGHGRGVPAMHARACGRVVRMEGKGHCSTKAGQSRTAAGWLVRLMLGVCRVRCTCTVYVLSSSPWRAAVWAFVLGIKGQAFGLVRVCA